MVLLCAVVSVMLWLFFAYHIHLVRQGYTTNESSKRSELKYFLEQAVEFYEEWERLRKKDPDAKPDARVRDYFRVDEKMTDAQITKMRKETAKELATLSKGSVWRAQSFV